MISLKPKKGKLLIAEPTLTGDVSFNRSVVLLAEHNDEGSVGFILNKPLNYDISDLIEDIDVPFQVFNGGPVEQDNLYFIHKVPHLIDNSIEISDGIFWGGDFDKTVKLINQKVITNTDIRFFLGYSGWSSLQLDQELDSKSWIVVKNEYESNIIQKSTIAYYLHPRPVQSTQPSSQPDRLSHVVPSDISQARICRPPWGSNCFFGSGPGRLHAGRERFDTTRGRAGRADRSDHRR